MQEKQKGVRCPCGSRHTYYKKWVGLYHCRTCKTDFRPAPLDKQSDIRQTVEKEDK